MSYPPDSTTVPGPPGADRGQQPVADSLPHGLPTRGTPGHATLEDLLRRIEDAIDAHSLPLLTGGPALLDGNHGPAILRAVLEQPLPEVDVCQHCRGRAWLNGPGGDTYWCRPCNGIGYVERAPLAEQGTPVVP